MFSYDIWNIATFFFLQDDQFVVITVLPGMEALQETFFFTNFPLKSTPGNS